ncbi:biopolymer transporter ExbD [Shewanella sp. JM162201]|uniref:Biopolymer transporter ExbD n=1 Tax=Shewanella jiangmenensis TaxID=2837387 RepID=A0ABS5V6M4_9GAMM|nr:biopolymer transporter ExbD [Shewanella jiangmenensis]MBT1446097.1 biopolymer transporter ExbD [Shewanella jiangmenensis]
MAFKKYAAEHEEAKVDMTPMLDIIFIMLIFFIVTTSFVKPMGIDYNKPESSARSSAKSDNILISVNKAGIIKMENRQVDIERLTANIERKLAETPGAAVLIQAEGETLHGVVVKVMDEVKTAGVKKISVTQSD